MFIMNFFIKMWDLCENGVRSNKNKICLFFSGNTFLNLKIKTFSTQTFLQGLNKSILFNLLINYMHFYHILQEKTTKRHTFQPYGHKNEWNCEKLRLRSSIFNSFVGFCHEKWLFAMTNGWRWGVCVLN